MRRLPIFVVATLITTAIAISASAAGDPQSIKVNRDSQSARSVVTALGADWVTVTSADRSQTFQVSTNTHVIGQGLATLAREKQKIGTGVTTLTDVVALNDQVVVSYKDVGGRFLASEIRLVGKRR